MGWICSHNEERHTLSLHPGHKVMMMSAVNPTGMMMMKQVMMLGFYNDEDYDNTLSPLQRLSSTDNI